MDKLTPYFPLNSRVKKGDIVSLVVTIVIYVVVAAVLCLLFGLLSGVPVLGFLIGIVGTLVWIYEIVGIVLAILSFI